jgi:RHS repeat-associated protein
VSANFTYDYLDRPIGLTVQVPGRPLQTVASAGSYRVGTGALKALTLGNSLVETRTYDGKNAPAGISVSSNRLAWAYTTDREGNPTAITQTQPSAEARTFGYQDFAYFLTGADGPWGTLDWSYDKIGNRLTQVRNGLAPGDLYTYLPNAATPTPGNTATLDRIDLAVGGTKDYTFGPAGHLERIDESLGATVYDHTAEGQLGTITRGSDQPAMAYDGRSFLRQATTANPTIFEDGFDTGDLSCWGVVAGGEEGDGPTRGGETCFTPTPGGAVTTSTYGSEGLLYSVERRASPTTAGTRLHLFYFAGRPVAEVEIPPTGAPTWTYLTTDHLGTPILATRSNNTERWRGGFEPFGTDWRAGTAAGASENGVFLRLPGQWVDGVWGDQVRNNVLRYLDSVTGLFTRPDPLRASPFQISDFAYVAANPLVATDPLGLFKVEYLAMPNEGVRRQCGGGALGCIQPKIDYFCRCREDGCSWKPSLIFGVNEPIPVIYSSDCYSPTRIQEEEMRHISALEGDYADAAAAARAFGRRRFSSESECMEECRRFAKGALRDALVPRWKHWWIDFTHPQRHCDGSFKW